MRPLWFFGFLKSHITRLLRAVHVEVTYAAKGHKFLLTALLMRWELVTDLCCFMYINVHVHVYVSVVLLPITSNPKLHVCQLSMSYESVTDSPWLYVYGKEARPKTSRVPSSPSIGVV